jgi:hypothetical protein
MPNWCSNTITISADEPEKIKEFVDFLEKNEGKDWFDFFLPTPSELTENDSNGWYTWNVENWGCKWNCNAQDWSVDENLSSVSFWFDSPWSPPVELYRFITQNTDFNIQAEYCEEGIGFVGEFIDGFEDTYEYETIDDLDDIPEHLIENWNLRDNLEDWEENDEN